mmetsp:Transcript_44655/g.113027  ORF Transcript_44655/g.113027 Transcript_44655/m.113027 type:complete len:238 (+) Transcript_44655:917-1630(+)
MGPADSSLHASQHSPALPLRWLSPQCTTCWPSNSVCGSMWQLPRPSAHSTGAPACRPGGACGGGGGGGTNFRHNRGSSSAPATPAAPASSTAANSGIVATSIIAPSPGEGRRTLQPPRMDRCSQENALPPCLSQDGVAPSPQPLTIYHYDAEVWVGKVNTCGAPSAQRQVPQSGGLLRAVPPRFGVLREPRQRAREVEGGYEGRQAQAGGHHHPQPHLPPAGRRMNTCMPNSEVSGF